MEYLDVYLQKYIIDFISPNEIFLIKFVNKNFYNLFSNFNIISKYPSRKELNNIKVLKWFIYNIEFIPVTLQKDIMKILICKGENTDFYFCLSRDFILSEKNIFYALKCENIDILDILMNEKCNFDYKTIMYAAEKGNYTVLKWLFRNINLCQEKIEETEYLIELLPLAIISKNIDCVKFLLKKNCHVNYSIILLTILHSKLNILEYILENIGHDLSIFFWPHNLLETAISVSKIDMIIYIYDKYRPQLKENLYDILLHNYEANIKKEKTVECILWLLAKNCKYNNRQKEILFKYNFINNYV